MEQSRTEQQEIVGESRELALFQVGDLICGLDTFHVREIIRYPRITVVHRSPDYVRGVINLRGDIVTIIDLRRKFIFEPSANEPGCQILIVTFGEEDIGLLVDAVSDVLLADSNDIEPPPSNLAGVDGKFFQGIYKLDKDLVTVIDLNALLKEDSHS